VDWRGYLVVALSQSGATPEIISTCQAVRAGGAVVLGITNEPDSPLAGAVDLVLSTDAGPEQAVPATKTVTAQLAVLATVTSALHAAPVPDGTLDGLPAAVAAVLADPGPVRRLAGRWQGLDRLVVAGRGLAYAAALETALKVKETTGILAEGISTADLLHGPIAAVYAGAPVLLVDGGGPADIDLEDLRVLLDSRHAQSAALPVPPGLPEAVHVIAAITRGQQLAYELAGARHVNPDAPAHLSKVTATT
jgi:glucosamine--fructose-6-phosphate aminotransferase (isomerizing)